MENRVRAYPFSDCLPGIKAEPVKHLALSVSEEGIDYLIGEPDEPVDCIDGRAVPDREGADAKRE